MGMELDNGGVFVADERQRFVSDHGINWKFNLDCAPVVWRRVGEIGVKSCIKYVVGAKKLTYVELETIVSEIELILDNQPIGVDYDDDQADVILFHLGAVEKRVGYISTPISTSF